MSQTVVWSKCVPEWQSCAECQLLAVTPVSKQTHTPGGSAAHHLFPVSAVSKETASAVLEGVMGSQG